MNRNRFFEFVKPCNPLPKNYGIQLFIPTNICFICSTRLCLKYHFIISPSDKDTDFVIPLSMHFCCPRLMFGLALAPQLGASDPVPYPLDRRLHQHLFFSYCFIFAVSRSIPILVLAVIRHVITI